MFPWIPRQFWNLHIAFLTLCSLTETRKLWVRYSPTGWTALVPEIFHSLWWILRTRRQNQTSVERGDISLEASRPCNSSTELHTGTRKETTACEFGRKRHRRFIKLFVFGLDSQQKTVEFQCISGFPVWNWKTSAKSSHGVIRHKRSRKLKRHCDDSLRHCSLEGKRL